MLLLINYCILYAVQCHSCGAAIQMTQMKVSIGTITHKLTRSQRLHFKCISAFKVKKISSVLLLINFYLSSWPLNNFFIPCFDLAYPSILINTLLYINCFCLDFQHFEQLWSRSDKVPKPLIMWVTGFESSSCQSWKWRNAFRYCLNELPHSLKPADHRWVKLFINVLFYIDAYFNLW